MRRTLYLSAVLATLSGGGVLAQSNAVQMLGLRGNIPGRPDAFSSNAVTKQAAKPARHYLPTNAQEVSTAFIGMSYSRKMCRAHGFTAPTNGRPSGLQ